jgi:hypothetical protein
MIEMGDESVHMLIQIANAARTLRRSSWVTIRIAKLGFGVPINPCIILYVSKKDCDTVAEFKVPASED